MAERTGWQQVSVFDQSNWLDREVCYLASTADEIASALGLMHEQSFDDFDYFQVVVLQRGSKKIAIMSRPRAPRPGSDIYLAGGATIEDVYEVLEACDELQDSRIVDTSGTVLRP